MGYELDASRVEAVFGDCLFKDGEDTSNHIAVHGVVHNVGFHPERLASHKDEVRQMLNELPESFREDKGGGWSFLMACNDRHGRQWTSFHLIMEQLFQLGMGLGMVVNLIPDREMWKVLPGGVPYFMIRTGEPS